MEVLISSERDDPTLAVRLLRSEDIPFCLAQTGREGWSSTFDDFAVHLTHDPEGCFVATVGGDPAGMVTTTRYGKTGWIGNLIIPPEFRGRGLGSALMVRAISCLESKGLRTLRLEADPLGIGIYRRLGFVDEYTSPRFRLEPDSGAKTAPVAQLGAGDIAAVASFDAPNFGDDRSRLLAIIHAKARAAFRVPRKGTIAGYLMVLRGARGLRLGPWVAENAEAAQELLAAAVSFAANQPLTLAVPGPNAVGQQLLRDAGFRETPSSLRMLRGPAAGWGRPENVYALTNGAVG